MKEPNIFSLKIAWVSQSAVYSLFFLLLSPSSAICGDYLDSAHGNSTAGVNRLATFTLGYSQGNCAHCHEMHASIGGAEPDPVDGIPMPFTLFSENFNDAAEENTYLQTDNFCFMCHTDTSSKHSGGVVNYDYSATFGGYVTDSTAGILQAFNQYSYHNLDDIKDFITDPAQSSWGYSSYSNPCTGCHNPHKLKRNKENVQDPSYTAISRPSDHGNLWGDDASERMDAASSGDYQAPYDTSGSTFEPLGEANGDGALTPDYNSFCLDCHQYSITSTVLTPLLGRDLNAINWSGSGGDGVDLGDKHGGNSATDYRDTSAPFDKTVAEQANFILACVDCHEPHGSPSAFLLRREVNKTVTAGAVYSKKTAPNVDDPSTISYLCEKCHNKGSGWDGIHHFDSEAPYNKAAGCSCHPGGAGSTPIPCENCHYHGSYVNDPTNDDDITPDNSPTTRTTF